MAGDRLSRRRFLGTLGLATSAALGGALLAACGGAPAANAPASTQPGSQQSASQAPASEAATKPTTAPAAAAPKASADAVEIRIHTNQGDQWAGWMNDAYEADIDGWKTKHPNIIPKLEPVPGWTDEYFPKIFALVSANQLGDIVWHPPRHRSHISWGTQYNIIRPLDDLMKARNFDPKKEYLAAALEASSADGKLYWLNYTGEPSVPVLAYNKTKIEAMGLAEPTSDMTFDDLAVWAKSATTDDIWGYSRGHHGGNPIGETPYLRQWGVELVDSTGKTATFADTKDQFVSALKWRQDLIYEWKVSPTPDAAGDPSDLFVAEKLLAMPVWPVFINRLPQVMVQDKFEVGFVLTPVVRKGDKRRSMLNEHVYGITAASQAPEQAFDYLTWITGKEFAIQGIFSGKGAPIARPDFWDDDRLYEKFPGLELLRDIMTNIEADFIVANFRGEQFDDAYVNVYQQLELNKITPEEAADQIQKDCQAVLDKEPA